MGKYRLDNRLMEKGLVESRSLAQRLIMAGQVRVNGQVVLKASGFVNDTDEIVVEKGPPFVSRGGEKLSASLPAFGMEDLTGWTCVDVGASTGGFHRLPAAAWSQ